MKPIRLLQMNPRQVADEIGRFIVQQVRRADMTGCVVGLSGGVDSTVAAALAARAFAKFKTSSAIVEDIRVRHKVALAKAEILHPPMPQVTLKYGAS